jgi:hypothetical protein
MIFFSNSQLRRFNVERIFGVNLVEAASSVEQDLPNVIHVSLPLVVETSLEPNKKNIYIIGLQCHNVNHRTEPNRT